MSSAEIARTLRAHRPAAPPTLRARVLALETQAPAQRRSFVSRRRLLVAMPVAAALLIVLGAGVVLSRSPGEQVTASGLAGTGARTGVESTTAPVAPSVALDAQAKLPTGAAASRARAVVASLVLAVENGSDVAPMAQRAIAIVDELGGFVAGSQVVSGENGYASLTVKVPSAQAEVAVTRLSQLGRIVSQDVQTQDLQETLDGLDRAIRIARTQLAAVLTRLAGNDLDAVERARLEARRDALREQLRLARTDRVRTATQAATATIQLELRTEDASSGAVAPSPLDRTLDRALAVLAWEGVAVLGLLLLVGPPLILGLVAWWLTRVHRRRAESRLLAST